MSRHMKTVLSAVVLFLLSVSVSFPSSLDFSSCSVHAQDSSSSSGLDEIDIDSSSSSAGAVDAILLSSSSADVDEIVSSSTSDDEAVPLSSSTAENDETESESESSTAVAPPSPSSTAEVPAVSSSSGELAPAPSSTAEEPPASSTAEAAPSSSAPEEAAPSSSTAAEPAPASSTAEEGPSSSTAAAPAPPSESAPSSTAEAGPAPSSTGEEAAPSSTAEPPSSTAEVAPAPSSTAEASTAPEVVPSSTAPEAVPSSTAPEVVPSSTAPEAVPSSTAPEVVPSSTAPEVDESSTAPAEAPSTAEPVPSSTTEPAPASTAGSAPETSTGEPAPASTAEAAPSSSTAAAPAPASSTGEESAPSSTGEAAPAPSTAEPVPSSTAEPQQASSTAEQGSAPASSSTAEAAPAPSSTAEAPAGSSTGEAGAAPSSTAPEAVPSSTAPEAVPSSTAPEAVPSSTAPEVVPSSTAPEAEQSSTAATEPAPSSTAGAAPASTAGSAPETSTGEPAPASSSAAAGSAPSSTAEPAVASSTAEAGAGAGAASSSGSQQPAAPSSTAEQGSVSSTAEQSTPAASSTAEGAVASSTATEPATSTATQPAASSTASEAAVASSTAGAAVAASSTAEQSVASSTAEQAQAASSTAQQTQAASSTAEQAAAASSTAEQAAAASSTAEQTAAASSTAEQTAAASSTAEVSAVSSTAEQSAAASSTAEEAAAASSTAEEVGSTAEESTNSTSSAEPSSTASEAEASSTGTETTEVSSTGSSEVCDFRCIATDGAEFCGQASDRCNGQAQCADRSDEDYVGCPYYDCAQTLADLTGICHDPTSFTYCPLSCAPRLGQFLATCSNFTDSSDAIVTYLNTNAATCASVNNEINAVKVSCPDVSIGDDQDGTVSILYDSVSSIAASDSCISNCSTAFLTFYTNALTPEAEYLGISIPEFWTDYQALCLPPSAPEAVTGLTVDTVLATSISLYWDIAHQLQAIALTVTYNVTYGTDPSELVWSATTEDTSIVLTGLVSNTTFYIAVTALTSVGSSPVSGIVQATTLVTPPAAPTNFAVSSPTQGSITGFAIPVFSVTFTWDAAGDFLYHLYTVASFEGEDVETEVASTALNTLTLSNSLDASTEYVFHLRASGPLTAPGAYAAVNVTTPDVPPSAPTFDTTTYDNDGNLLPLVTSNSVSVALDNSQYCGPNNNCADVTYVVVQAQYNSTANDWEDWQPVSTLAYSADSDVFIIGSTGLTAATQYKLSVTAQRSSPSSVSDPVVYPFTTVGTAPTVLAAPSVSATDLSTTLKIDISRPSSFVSENGASISYVKIVVTDYSSIYSEDFIDISTLGDNPSSLIIDTLYDANGNAEPLVPATLYGVAWSFTNSLGESDLSAFNNATTLLAAPTVQSVTAHDGDGTPAFAVDDYLVVAFSEATNTPAISDVSSFIVFVPALPATLSASWSTDGTSLTLNVTSAASVTTANFPFIGSFTAQVIGSLTAAVSSANVLNEGSSAVIVGGTWGVPATRIFADSVNPITVLAESTTRVTVPWSSDPTAFTSGLVSVQATASHGVVSVASNSSVDLSQLQGLFGQFSYSPNVGAVDFVGKDAIVIIVIDSANVIQTATIPVTVTRIVHAPVIHVPTGLSYSAGLIFTFSNIVLSSLNDDGKTAVTVTFSNPDSTGQPTFRAVLPFNATNGVTGSSNNNWGSSLTLTGTFTALTNFIDAGGVQYRDQALHGDEGSQSISIIVNDNGIGGVSIGAKSSSAVLTLALTCAQSPVPAAQSAVFSNDLTSITVTFDSPLIVTDPSITNCASFFDGTTVSKLGTTASCFLSSATTVHISLSVFTITTTDFITVASPSILYRCSSASGPASTSPVSVSAPAAPLAPTVTLSGQTKVGLCETLQLSAVAGSVAGQVSYYWSSSVAGVIPDGSLSSSSLSIPPVRLTTGTTYTFSVHVVNFLGISSNTATLVVTKSGLAIPGLTTTSPLTSSYYLSDSFEIDVTATLPSCLTIPDKTLSFSWTSSPLLSDTSIYPSNPSLIINPYQLVDASGTATSFVFTVTAFAASSPSLTNSLSLTVNVIPSAFIVSAGSSRKVSSSSDLTLTSSAVDPDNRAGSFIYQWSCKQGDSACVNQKTKLPLVAPSTQSWVIPSGSLSALSYVFSVAVHKTNRAVVVSSTTITVTAGTIPTIAVSASASLINARDPLVLISSGASADVTSYQWSVSTGSSSILGTAPSITGVNLVLNAQAALAWNPGSQYTFRLTVANSNGASSYAETTVTVNSPPQGGTLSISNSTLVGYTTAVDLSAANWISAAHLPLSYFFYYSLDGTDTSKVLIGANPGSPTATGVFIPPGNCISGYQVTIFLYVIDTFQGATVSRQVITVRPSASAASDANSYLSTAGKTFVDTSNSKGLCALIQGVTTSQTTLRACLASGSGRRLLSVVATPSLLSQTNSSVSQIKSAINVGGSAASVLGSCYPIVSDPTSNDQWTLLNAQSVCATAVQKAIAAAAIPCSPSQLMSCTTSKQNVLHSALNVVLNGLKTFNIVRAANAALIATHGRRLLASPATNNSDASELYSSLASVNSLLDTLASTFFAAGQVAQSNSNAQYPYAIRRDAVGAAVSYTFPVDNTTVTYPASFLSNEQYTDSSSDIDTRAVLFTTNVFDWVSSPGVLVSNILATNRTNTSSAVVTASTSQPSIIAKLYVGWSSGVSNCFANSLCTLACYRFDWVNSAWSAINKNVSLAADGTVTCNINSYSSAVVAAFTYTRPAPSSTGVSSSTASAGVSSTAAGAASSTGAGAGAAGSSTGEGAAATSSSAIGGGGSVAASSTGSQPVSSTGSTPVTVISSTASSSGVSSSVSSSTGSVDITVSVSGPAPTGSIAITNFHLTSITTATVLLQSVYDQLRQKIADIWPGVVDVSRVLITSVSQVGPDVDVELAITPDGSGNNLSANDMSTFFTDYLNGNLDFGSVQTDPAVAPEVAVYCDVGRTDCSSSSSNAGLAIGLGVGIPLGLVAIGLIWYAIKRSRASKYGRVADRNRGQGQLLNSDGN